MAENKLYCTFYLDKHCFGVEVEKVQEVFRYQDMTRVPLSSAAVQGLINLRGQIITALDLRHRLEMPKRTREKQPMNVVVRTEEGVVSLLVDEIGDVVEVSEDTYEQAPQTIQGTIRELIHGVYKLDKQLLMILDTESAINVTALVA